MGTSFSLVGSQIPHPSLRSGWGTRQMWAEPGEYNGGQTRYGVLVRKILVATSNAGKLRDLNAILDYVAELNELDTSGVSPLAQVSELETAATASVLRADQMLPSLDRAAVMAQAPETDKVFFKVPKVIER